MFLEEKHSYEQPYYIETQGFPSRDLLDVLELLDV